MKRHRHSMPLNEPIFTVWDWD